MNVSTDALPKKQKARWKKLAIGGCSVTGLCALSIFALYALAFWGGGGEPANLAVATRVSQQFVQTIHDQQIETAYAMLSEKFSPPVTVAQFERLIQRDLIFAGRNFQTAQNRCSTRFHQLFPAFLPLRPAAGRPHPHPLPPFDKLRAGYTGQRNEAALGLYFYNARWYDPMLGRFVQADTLVPGAGSTSAALRAGLQAWDRYAYVNNNPLRYTDPSGHIACNNSRLGEDRLCYKNDMTKWVRQFKDNNYRVFMGAWHLSVYTYADPKQIMEDAPRGKENASFSICEYHGSCGQITLPKRFVFGREGIAMQGTGILPNGKPVHGSFVGNWLPDPGKSTEDYFDGTATLFYGWGRPGREMEPYKDGAVGPSYVDQTYYIPLLEGKGGNDSGIFRAIDRGGAITDGDIDVFVGTGMSASWDATHNERLSNPTNYVPVYSDVVNVGEVVTIFAGR